MGAGGSHAVSISYGAFEPLFNDPPKLCTEGQEIEYSLGGIYLACAQSRLMLSIHGSPTIAKCSFGGPQSFQDGLGTLNTVEPKQHLILRPL